MQKITRINFGNKIKQKGREAWSGRVGFEPTFAQPPSTIQHAFELKVKCVLISRAMYLNHMAYPIKLAKNQS